MRYFLLVCLLYASVIGYSQPVAYTVANAHSHNDYEKPFPFWSAWRQQFGSIEVDIFLEQGELLVAHDRIQLKQHRTLDSLYLEPLAQCIAGNNGYVYADTSRRLQFMIDIKTDAQSTLEKLVEQLKEYPSLVNSSSLKIVISGNRPQPSRYNNWPSWIWFDGELQKEYTNTELSKIEMLSDNFARYTLWNGKGRLPAAELEKLQATIDRAHQLQKKVRFWNAPDILNTWYQLISMKVDYVNTDKIDEISSFMKQLPERAYTAPATYEPYQPTYKNDGSDKTVKNVIILIGDGTGLAQWYAGYTANKAKLNVFSMKHGGLSKTSSYDNYITDSAPGATSISSGTKTNNRAVGVDHTGKALELLPTIVQRRKMKTGIITSGDLRDATPAAFYAHQSERSNYKDIINDLVKAPVDIIMGACEINKTDTADGGLRNKFTMVSSLDNVSATSNTPLFVADSKAGLSILNGRGDWAVNALEKSLQLLSQNKDGFLLMLEGAQVDHGGHSNKLPYVVTELLDFDRVIGKAMEFADKDGKTLIIVTADHETGGLTLTGGDYSKGYISGQFSTEDHTAIPVPVFSYGPQSQLFDGVYENTEIFNRILKVLKIR